MEDWLADTVKSIQMKDGDSILEIGCGTGMILFSLESRESYLDAEFLEDVLKRAIQNGYRHFDESEVYTTEPVLGRALKAFPNIPRSELFITSKVHPWMGIKDKDVEGALRKSLEALGLDYVDLYLIHTPFMEIGGLSLEEAWASMEAVKANGLARHIGVSNFRPNSLERLLRCAREKPEVNQIELHPYHYEHDTVECCRGHDIRIAAYGPLTPVGRSANGPLRPILDSMAGKYKVTPGQVLLKWQHQQGFLTITTTTKDERQKAQLVLDFSLEEGDVRLITEEGAKFPQQLCGWGTGSPREGETIDYEELLSKSL
ncbi:hypothetical protein SERLA73DRAFT_110988 [Serpula lacrymans var. lacrymans S7.3]|uniref:NADP-dependent oxidoreductase domain-containing protein n=2 Tax=Serpula lacrymans var. lacrymans TaxID=341189 RepID=F8Q397_SERL3|nr:uncharacterized protein SERLADRAFT_362477 [Serpula lacrymans var. lacrymans S7.9]EGN97658.1 hypothetical protein SERLA73DRAFT_110988 [Serpula lacrymans var. lacrymans S7.3]EGO23253.1 hypothetical protein SERLADRAFT_362477 [Serpula lacrymans var. lacrymans S7.9]